MPRVLLFFWAALLVVVQPLTAVLAQTPTPIPAVASGGCEAANSVAPGLTEITLDVDDTERSYLRYIPDSYSPETPAPLVLSFHGFASSPQDQLAVTAWNDLADAQGFIAVYPTGTGMPLRWSSASGGVSFGGAPVDDVAFVSAMLNSLAEELCLDTSRIFASGFSAGGAMTYILACELADRVAAFGMVSGSYNEPEDGCEPARPVPLIAFHGTADTVVPYDGGQVMFFSFAPVGDWVQAWVERDGCEPQPETVTDGDITTQTYSQCDDEVQVIFYAIEGGGHAWPGSAFMLENAPGETTDAVSATALMWDFFSRYTLP